MSLKVPCKYCGKTISLRRMPNGHFVPFDKGTNTQHRCQEQPASSTTESDSDAKSHVDASASVGDLVFRIVSELPGMKARQIASTISKRYGVNVDRSEVNRWLYHDLRGKVYQNASYRWFPGVPSLSSAEENQPTRNTESGVQQSANKLLWAIIVLLVIVVLILLSK